MTDWIWHLFHCDWLSGTRRFPLPSIWLWHRCDEDLSMAVLSSTPGGKQIQKYGKAFLNFFEALMISFYVWIPYFIFALFHFSNNIYLDQIPLYRLFHRYIPNSFYYNKIYLQMPSAAGLSYCSGPTGHKMRNLLAVLDIHIDKAKFVDTPALEWHCVQVAPASLPRFRICAAKYLLNDQIFDYINYLELLMLTMAEI